jgi:hypothetical protein
LYDGKVYWFDPSKMQLTGQTNVGPYPDRLLTWQGQVVVACGNLSTQQTDNRLFFLNPNTQAVARTLTLPTDNPGVLLALPDGSLLVEARSTYFLPGNAALYRLADPLADPQLLFELPGKSFGSVLVANHSIYLVYGDENRAEDQFVGRLQYTVAVSPTDWTPDWLSRAELGIARTETPYALAWDSTRAELHITVSAGVLNGRSVVVQPASRQVLRTLPAGVFPGQVLFYRRR